MSSSPGVIQVTDSLRGHVQYVGIVTGMAATLFFQAGTAVTPPPYVPTQPKRVEIISTIPDGLLDPYGILYRGIYGLEAAHWSLGKDDVTSIDEITGADLARGVQEISGLTIVDLARIMKVSRTAYHDWMREGHISATHIARLHDLYGTLQTLQDIHGDDLAGFLKTPGPAGVPTDLLAEDDASAVIGLALRPAAGVAHRSQISAQARQIAGANGWLHPVAPLAWDTPQLSDVEEAQLLEDLSPSPRVSAEALKAGESDNEPAFIARGFYLE